MNLLRNKPKEMVSPSYPTLGRMRDEMERAFDRFVRDPFDLVVHPDRKTWMPALDVTDTESEIVVKAEVPGMSAKDVHVALSGNRLTLSGEKEETKEEKSECCYVSERSFGSFHRTIDLPDGLDPDRVTAEQADGVLTVRVGKLKSAKPRHIPVKSHV